MRTAEAPPPFGSAGAGHCANIVERSAAVILEAATHCDIRGRNDHSGPGGLPSCVTQTLPPLEYPGQFNVEIELALAQGVRPTGFDRLNTLWWTLPLVRLSTGAMLRIRKQPEANPSLPT